MQFPQSGVNGTTDHQLLKKPESDPDLVSFAHTLHTPHRQLLSVCLRASLSQIRPPLCPWGHCHDHFTLSLIQPSLRPEAIVDFSKYTPHLPHVLTPPWPKMVRGSPAIVPRPVSPLRSGPNQILQPHLVLPASLA